MKHFTNSFGVLSAFAVIIQAVLVSDESKLRSLCICQSIIGSRAMMRKLDEEGLSRHQPIVTELDLLGHDGFQTLRGALRE